MCLNHADDDVLPAAVSPDSFAEHVESLTHSRRISQEELEYGRLLLWCGLLQPFLRGLWHVVYHPRCSSKSITLADLCNDCCNIRSYASPFAALSWRAWCSSTFDGCM